MNSKTFVIALLTSTLAVAPAWADRYDDRGREHRDYARVVDVRPVVRLVEVTTPRRECWEEQVMRHEPRRHASAVPALVGGLIGGAIGHNLGHGRGIATVAGTLIGASVADSAAHADLGDTYYTDTEQRCTVRQETVTEERTLGYDVTYKYKGEIYTARMDRHPGERIPVRVSVEPTY